MKEGKGKPHRNALAQQFKEKCKETLKTDPKAYLAAAIRDNALLLDLALFLPDDLPLLPLLLALPLHSLHFFTPDSSQTSPKKPQQPPKTFVDHPKFKDFLRCVGQALEENPSIRVLKLERTPLPTRCLKELADSLRKTKSLRELSVTRCGLTEEQLEGLKVGLAENESLISLDLSQNELCEVGSMVGKVLSEHVRRRSELIWLYNLRGETPAEDISSMGLCEVNLEGNRLNDKAVSELVAFLRDDGWTKCLNLRRNDIRVDGVKELALMLKKNSSLISLDLRDNEGLTREYSRYIYKKLVLNMDRYKQQREKADRQREQLQTTPAKQQNQQQTDAKCKSQKNYERNDKKYTSFIERRDLSGNNLTIDQRKPQVDAHPVEPSDPACSGCKRRTFELLRLEKQNLDLELQLRKVKNALLTRNIDISAILPSPQQTSDWLGRENEGEDELLQRMEQVMLELTRVMETIEEQQATKGHITNPLDNPNSFSNTIQLYNPNSQLQDLSKSIAEERQAHEQLLGGTSIDHHVQDD